MNINDSIALQNAAVSQAVNSRTQTETAKIIRVHSNNTYDVLSTGLDEAMENRQPVRSGQEFEVGETVIIIYPYGKKSEAQILDKSNYSIPSETTHNFESGTVTSPKIAVLTTEYDYYPIIKLYDLDLNFIEDIDCSTDTGQSYSTTTLDIGTGRQLVFGSEYNDSFSIWNYQTSKLDVKSLSGRNTCGNAKWNQNDGQASLITTWHGDGSHEGSYLSKYNSDGSYEDLNFQVDSGTTTSEYSIALYCDANYIYAVCWNNFTTPGSVIYPHIMKFDYAGTKILDFRTDTYNSYIRPETGLWVDSSGNIYTSNRYRSYFTNRLIKFTPAGVFSSYIIMPAHQSSGYLELTGDTEDNIYCIEKGGTIIRKYDSSGSLTKSLTVSLSGRYINDIVYFVD